jgi:NADPH:quinone reductase-like Zn-dependent oxidoreductase
VTTDVLDAVAAALADGTLQPPVIEALPLDAAGEALARAGSRHTRGKLVLEVS